MNTKKSKGCKRYTVYKDDILVGSNLTFEALGYIVNGILESCEDKIVEIKIR